MCLATLALALGGGVAFATIPGSGGMINGCYERSGGLLRVIDAGAGATCRPSETSLEAITLTCKPTTLYALSVVKAGSGEGTVSSSDGIDCGSVCSKEYGPGTSVTLTATASGDDVFSGWSGACSGGDTTCTVTLDAAKSVTAEFTGLYRLSVAVSNHRVLADCGGFSCPTGYTSILVSGPGIACGAGPNYPGATDCTELFRAGEAVTLTAQGQFDAAPPFWDGCDSLSAEDTCNVAMNRTRSVQVYG
jgi:hypothetical protein